MGEKKTPKKNVTKYKQNIKCTATAPKVRKMFKYWVIVFEMVFRLNRATSQLMINTIFPKNQKLSNSFDVIYERTKKSLNIKHFMFNQLFLYVSGDIFVFHHIRLEIIIVYKSVATD